MERNEFDTSQSYFLWMVHCRNAVVRQNRFLSFTFDSNTGFVPTSGSPFMRPPVQVLLGDGTSGAGAHVIWNCEFEENYHRSINGALQTTAPVSGYAMFPGSTEVTYNRFINNDMIGRDGFSQNSLNMTRYANIDPFVQNNVITEQNGVRVMMSTLTPTPVGNNSLTLITLDRRVFDNQRCMTANQFNTPYTAAYDVSALVTFDVGLAAGNIVTVGLYVNAVLSVSETYVVAGSAANQGFRVSQLMTLTETDRMDVRVTQNSGATVNTVGNIGTRLSVSQVPVS
jgi:hypothetical protein